MDPEAEAAVSVIRQCIENDNYFVTQHFRDRMGQRGLLWVDVLSVVESPDDVRDDGIDREGRPKWVVAGPAADGLPIEVVCVLDRDDAGRFTVFFTIYFED